MAQAVLEQRGTPIVFTNTGGDKLLNAKNLGTITGRLSAFYDRGEGASPCEYELRIFTAWVANPAVTDTLRFAVVQSDGTHSDAGLTYDASSDAALTVNEINSLFCGAGAVSAHTADANEKGTSRIVRVSSRYFAVALFNASTTKALANTDGATTVTLTPLHPEIQDS